MVLKQFGLELFALLKMIEDLIELMFIWIVFINIYYVRSKNRNHKIYLY